LDLSLVTMISTNETSAKRGHEYATTFMDTKERNVIHVTKGKDSGTWAECKKHLEAHGGSPEKVMEVCMDMSPAFIKGATDHFSEAAITFDKFRAIQAVNKAVYKVQRQERKSCADLKNTRYI
jgi:transposase